jgi:hypothetical protein
MPSNQDLSDILEPVSSNAAPTHDLSDILEPASPTKSATPSEPKTYHGFTFVEANGPETPAHYESPNGQWILPEDIERAHTEYNSKIEREAERRYNDSNAILKHGAGLNRVFLHGATIGHEPQLEASISPLLGESYSEERDIARRQLEKYREEHPYMATAGELAGGVASIFAAPELLPTRASTALSYLNPANIGKAGRYIAELPFISRNFFQGAGAGIPYGAAYASGESQAPTFSG